MKSIHLNGMMRSMAAVSVRSRLYFRNMKLWTESMWFSKFIKLCVFRDLTDKAWASGSGYCVFRSHLGSHRARVLYILVEQERTVLIWHLQMSHLQMITNTLLDLQAKESFSVRKVKDLTEKTVCTLCPHLMTTVQPVLVFTLHS